MVYPNVSHEILLGMVKCYIITILQGESLIYSTVDLFKDANGNCLYTASKPLSVFLFTSLGLVKSGPYNNLINQELRK